MLKSKYFLLVIGILGVFVIGVGTAQAIRSLTKDEQIQIKQEMKLEDTGKFTDRIGVFAPGFESEAQEAVAEYVKEYGEGNFKVVTYKGHTLIVPPGRAGELSSIEEQVDAQMSAQESSTPPSKLQTIQIAMIKDVFGVKGTVTYNAAMGAYTDDKGFQYNFSDGGLVNKQVGANDVLQAKFEQAYPHFKAGVERAATITNERARNVTDQIISKLFSTSQSESLKANVKYEDLGEVRLGIVYGNREAQFLVDLVTGDVIHYSKIK
jgi:hypothetical protein